MSSSKYKPPFKGWSKNNVKNQSGTQKNKTGSSHGKQDKQEGFLNVYNFVPFSGNRAEKYEDSGEFHTGVIEYTIETKTPLFIPDPNNVKIEKIKVKEKDKTKEVSHKVVPFYSYPDANGRDLPVIPGSEIRGMVRSIYETITNSCMGVLNAEARPVKRTGEMFKPGLIRRIEKDGNVSYELYSAELKYYKYLTNMSPDEKEGKYGTFECEKRQNNKKQKDKDGKIKTEEVTGCLLKGQKGRLLNGQKGRSGGKKYSHVFVNKGILKSKLMESDLKGLELVIKSYQDQPGAEDSYKEYEDQFMAFRKGAGSEYFPVWFSILDAHRNTVQNGNNADNDRNNKVYLSPSCITKEISNNTIGKLARGYNPCVEKSKSCPACDLFGMIGKDNNEARASRVRFADAGILDDKKMDREESFFERQMTIPELSSPKLGNTEFYLKRPKNASFWTYDYYFTKSEQAILYNPELRGRKFYYNQPNTDRDIKKWLDIDGNSVIKKSDRNMTVRPVKPETKFTGKVYFDKISDKQLKQLMWILNSGMQKGEESDIVYKLGAAKPLGFGSVKLTVDTVTERRISYEEDEVRYINETIYSAAKNSYIETSEQQNEIAIQSYEDCGFDKECKGAFMVMVSYEKMKDLTISYPMTQKQKENDWDIKHCVDKGFEWFKSNHKYYGTSGRNKKIDFSAEQNSAFINTRCQNATKSELPMPVNGSGKMSMMKYYDSQAK